jgi:hypothetical protein
VKPRVLVSIGVIGLGIVLVVIGAVSDRAFVPPTFATLGVACILFGALLPFLEGPFKVGGVLEGQLREARDEIAETRREVEELTEQVGRLVQLPGGTAVIGQRPPENATHCLVDSDGPNHQVMTFLRAENPYGQDQDLDTIVEVRMHNSDVYNLGQIILARLP